MTCNIFSIQINWKCCWLFASKAHISCLSYISIFRYTIWIISIWLWNIEIPCYCSIWISFLLITFNFFIPKVVHLEIYLCFRFIRYCNSWCNSWNNWRWPWKCWITFLYCTVNSISISKIIFFCYVFIWICKIIVKACISLSYKHIWIVCNACIYIWCTRCSCTTIIRANNFCSILVRC